MKKNKYPQAISNWSIESRPREKLLLKGTDALSDAELLSIFLRVGGEPLLSDLGELNLEGINWMIVGGESGPMAREMLPQWAINIKDQCLKQNIPYFFKQWGGLNKKRNERILEGKEWSQMPIQN